VLHTTPQKKLRTKPDSQRWKKSKQSLHLSLFDENPYETDRRYKSLVDTPPGLTVITTVSREQELWAR